MSTWEHQYRAAVSESNPALVPALAETAIGAFKAQMRVLMMGDSSTTMTEMMRLSEALHNVRNLVVDATQKKRRAASVGK